MSDLYPDLKTCPSCGSRAGIADKNKTERGLFARVICIRNKYGVYPDRCYMKTTAGPIEKVIEVWNNCNDFKEV